MEKKNSINIKSIILSISLAIIVAITIIMSLGIGIEIFQPKAQSDYKTFDVAAKQLNELDSKQVKLDGKDVLALDLNTFAASHKLNKLENLNKTGNKLEHKLVVKNLDNLGKQLSLADLTNSRLSLDNNLNDNHDVLDLVSLQSLTKLQSGLKNLA